MAKERKNPAKITERQNKKKKIFYVFLLVLILILVWITGNLINKGNKLEGEGRVENTATSQPTGGELIVATTTSLEDSGLLDQLRPVFEKESGLKVKVIAVGTGEALEMGRRQVADLLLVHAPDLEAKFMEDGFGVRREEFMASEMAVAGPSADEAGIRGKSLVEAFKRIASARRPFISRADKSGTHHLELKIWEASGINPSGDWYLQTGQGMAESLRIASEKQAYILTDYPTFQKLAPGLNLEILSRDEQHKNIYSAIAVRNITGKINTAAAEALIDFLISARAQKIISEFGRKSPEDRPLFTPLRLGQSLGEGE
ncbi:MAG: substrate-binding domain-containing protein [Candidatus Aminicenantes bacterium]|nr:substrate-binding domain-containing protein [Candidatus Aminicenantes bacterium]